MTVPGPGDYSDETEVELLGRRVRLLEFSREVSTTMPVYPGHVGVAFWDHLTHEQVRRTRLPPDSPFRGYVVRGIVGSEHVSTHVDAIWHFNPDRPDLTIDKLPWEHLITPAAWIDVSDVPPREHIRLDRVRRALDDVEVTLRPGMTLLYYTGVGQLWDEPFRFLSEFPGLDREASEWLLDQGLVNVADRRGEHGHARRPQLPEPHGPRRARGGAHRERGEHRAHPAPRQLLGRVLPAASGRRHGLAGARGRAVGGRCVRAADGIAGVHARGG